MKAWDTFITSLEQELGDKTTKKWLRSLKVVSFDARNLYLEASDTFQQTWFEEHVRPRALKKFLSPSGKSIVLHVNLPENRNNTHSSKNKSKSKENSQFIVTFEPLDPKLQFNTFLPTEETLLPYKLLTKVASYDDVSKKYIRIDDPLPSFNPIFIHGPSGSGKTHLLQATANALKEQKLRVLYTTAQRFTEHVVKAIRGGEMKRFRETYRNTDALFLDDVHIFGRKWATQEELFHTFNTLHQAGKQIFVSANVSPQELTNIEPRLISRFEWGIALPIKETSKENRIHILNKKIESWEQPIPQIIKDFLLNSFTSSIRSLIKAYETLIIRTQLSDGDEGKKSFRLDHAKNRIKDLIEQEKLNSLTMDKISLSVSDHFGVALEAIKSDNKERNVSFCRKIAMYLLRIELELTYKSIGDYLKKDHSTVIAGIKDIKKGLEGNDLSIQEAVRSIKKSYSIS